MQTCTTLTRPHPLSCKRRKRLTSASELRLHNVQKAITAVAIRLLGEQQRRRWLRPRGQAWLDRQRGHLKPAGYVTIEATWRQRVLPRSGNAALGDIRPTAVEQWISNLGRGPYGAKPVGASVIRRAHYVFSSILADAVRDNLLARNPAAGVKLPTTTRKRPMYLTHQQVGALAAAAGEYEGLVLLLAIHGLEVGRSGRAAGSRSQHAAPAGHSVGERRPVGFTDFRRHPQGP